ncbi:hypothetical protein Chor_016195 [Crotalus horridus]
MLHFAFIRDTSIESSVVTKVKGFGNYSNRIMDTADYVTPPQGTSVFVIITKLIVTENQVQGFCPENNHHYQCTSDSECKKPVSITGGGILTGRCVNFNATFRTCQIQGWCPAEMDNVDVPVMLEAENFTLFIKNSIRFPLFNFEKYAKYYKQENGTEFRTLMKAYGIRFDVLVYGNAGKFNIIPTLINCVAAFTSVGVGTVLCDIILLNFLKGADQYKAKKFEEVSETVLHPNIPSSSVYRSDQTLGGRCEEKQSTDSGAYSIGL